MELILRGHDDRYAIEQLQMALFPAQTIEGRGQALSTLHRGNTWLTATTAITLDGKTTRVSRRLKAAEETVRLRRQVLQQSYYLAALPHLPGARWQVYGPPSSPLSICWMAAPQSPRTEC